jgi:hypothetical protein
MPRDKKREKQRLLARKIKRTVLLMIIIIREYKMRRVKIFRVWKKKSLSKKNS